MKKTKTYATVICRSAEHDVIGFYLRVKNEEFYLFSADYDAKVFNQYCKGVGVDRIFSKSSYVPVQRISERIIRMIKYIEKECGICVLKQTQKRNSRKYSYRNTA
jgi:hypothetical protein